MKASNCDLSLAGLQLYSYCKELKKRARASIEKNMKEEQTVKLPELMKKLESKLAANIGSTVTVMIPWKYIG